MSIEIDPERQEQEIRALYREIPVPYGRRRKPGGHEYETSATPMELAEMREWAVKLDIANGRLTSKFTCDGCGAAPTCGYVFDGYNTGGDCLAEK